MLIAFQLFHSLRAPAHRSSYIISTGFRFHISGAHTSLSIISSICIVSHEYPLLFLPMPMSTAQWLVSPLPLPIASFLSVCFCFCPPASNLSSTSPSDPNHLLWKSQFFEDIPLAPLLRLLLLFPLILPSQIAR